MSKQVVFTVPPDVTQIVINVKPEEPQHYKGERGVDVSKWQGEVDWKAMARDGISFCGIRATTGTRGPNDYGLDPFFKRNWAGAKAALIQRCAYHYFVNNGIDPVLQLNNFLEALGDDLGELPPVLDVEAATGQAIFSKDINTRNIAIWLTEFENRTGIRPVIYTNLYAWDQCTTIPPWSPNYKLWLAQYTSAPAPKVPLPWKEAYIWQWSRSGNVGGKSPIDMDRFGPY